MKDRNLLRAVCFAAGALITLTALVAFANDPPSKICGDVDASGDITASDALLVLVKSVGLDVELRCNNRRKYNNEIDLCPDGQTAIVDVECIPN